MLEAGTVALITGLTVSAPHYSTCIPEPRLYANARVYPPREPALRGSVVFSFIRLKMGHKYVHVSL